jgi:hypothetical protein
VPVSNDAAFRRRTPGVLGDDRVITSARGRAVAALTGGALILHHGIITAPAWKKRCSALKNQAYHAQVL